MPAEGGPSRRLTWLGPDTLVRGWTPQGHILFVSTYGQPFFRNHQAFSARPGRRHAAAAGAWARSTTWPSAPAARASSAATPPTRRAGSATAAAPPGTCGSTPTGSGQFRRMSELRGNLSCPMWIGERIYFLSDAEGVGNLYSCLPDGSDAAPPHRPRRLLRAPRAERRPAHRLPMCGASCGCSTRPAATHHALDIDVPSARTQAARRFVPADAHLGSARAAPGGPQRGARRARQDLHACRCGKARCASSGVADGVRYRHGQWLADGRTLVAVSDASGEERLELHADGSVRELDWDLGHVDSLRAAPMGTRVALANHRNQLLIGDTASGSCTVVDHSDAGRCEDLAWSADGGWLAYSYQATARQRAIKLCEVAHADLHAGDAARVPRLQPGLRPAGPLALLPVAAHLRPGVRQRAVRDELSARRAALPGGAAGRRHVALRSAAAQA